MPREHRAHHHAASPTAHRLGARRARAKFLRFFPQGFRDETYEAWERDYKWQAHLTWRDRLSAKEFRRLLDAGAYKEIADRAVKIESRTNLLFSFEKIALRDAVRTRAGVRLFAEGLYEFLHGGHAPGHAFEGWCEAVAQLPRRQTRVLTWPVVTVFGFLADPKRHFFLKPRVTRRAATVYAHDLAYSTTPNAETYQGVLDFARTVRSDLQDLRPRDMIDIQSFLWVLGSDEYEEAGKHWQSQAS